MPFIIRFYVDPDGGEPAKRWLDSLPTKAVEKARIRLDLLERSGNKLRRPYADYLHDGIYELRWESQNVQYRLLYFFSGRKIIILSHGITKTNRIPEPDIRLAIQRKQEVEGKRER